MWFESLCYIDLSNNCLVIVIVYAKSINRVIAIVVVYIKLLTVPHRIVRIIKNFKLKLNTN